MAIFTSKWWSWSFYRLAAPRSAETRELRDNAPATHAFNPIRPQATARPPWTPQANFQHLMHHCAQSCETYLLLSRTLDSLAPTTDALPPCALAGARARRRAPGQTIAHAARRTRHAAPNKTRDA